MNIPKIYRDDFFKVHEALSPTSFDLIFTDPPYGLFGEEIEALDWDNPVNLYQLEKTFSRLLKPTGLAIISCNLEFLTDLQNAFGAHLILYHHYVWRKPGGMPVNKLYPITNHEFVGVFRRPGVHVSDLTWHPRESGRIGEPYEKKNTTADVPTRRMKKSKVNTNSTGKRYMKSVLDAPSKPNMKKEERTSHPTQKPLALLRPLIRTYSNPGDTILDPFAGSGSSLIAAALEGRNAIGYEIEKKYFDEAQQRLEQTIPAQMDVFTAETPNLTHDLGEK